MGDRHKAMAVERGLTVSDVKQLEHLARLLHDTTLADLLISPIRYNRAVARYLTNLRTGSTSSARYFGIVVELTRLRRKVHPPGNIMRFLHSSRELPEGEQVLVAPKGAKFGREGAVWSVNEDHFEVRLGDSFALRGMHPGVEIELELNRPGQGLYKVKTTIRKVEAEPRPVVRLEHTEHIAVENRREHLRERKASPIFVTSLAPGAPDEPFEATLQDISGGGLSFLLNESVPEGTSVRITLALGLSEAPPIKAHASILRGEDTPNGQFSYFAQWDDSLAEDEREAIIRYVFGLQRRRIRTARLA